MALVDSIDLLRESGVRMTRGLSKDELRATEERFGFRFSPDHRTFLSLVQPVGNRWWNWRGDESILEEALESPGAGVLWDVEHNDFWPHSWGDRPEASVPRLERAADIVSGWPVLVPVYSHRYVPAAPAGPGAPVFSVWQTDVIFYGRDLADYLSREFRERGALREGLKVDPGVYPPWSLLATGRDDEI